MERELKLPWQRGILAEWSIVGMNHYHVDGERRLFVAMTKGGQCIKSEGQEDEYLWNRLWRQADDIAQKESSCVKGATCP